MHPLPHDQHDVSFAPIQPTDAPSSRQVSPHQSPNPHGRRLQLRNARFTASPISSRRTSPILSLVGSPIESFSRIKDHERSPPRIENRSRNTDGLPPNILQEIQNSAKRKKKTFSKEGFGRIFQESRSMDDENTRPFDDDGETSWYEEKSNECTPSRGVLQEGSLNQKTQPPLSPPSARTKTRSSLSADVVEQSRYIEHLESQLASAQAKIDALTSPKTNKLRSVKLRSLTTENRNLTKDNSEWAKRAEEMVQEEKKKYASLELDFNSLREDLEIKDTRIAESEWELEAMRTHLRDAEGLEAANANLEKKIDMLSGLLVNSPNKPGVQSAATSPKKLSSPVKKRPISVLSRVSSSSNGARMSLASASETAFWDSRSRSASILERQEDPSLEQTQSPVFNADNISPDSSKRFSFTDSYDDHRNSASLTSRTGPSSRPTSFMSTSSLGVPIQYEGDSKYSNRPRKMRKFPSGSNTLKPLILPVAFEQSLPASAPIYPSITTVAHRDISEYSSMDPTTAFLRNLEDNFPCSTPTAQTRLRSTTLAREETLKALEGRRSEMKKEYDGSSSEESEGSNPRNLQKELEQANFNALGISEGPDNISHHQLTPPTLKAHETTLKTNHSRSLFARITSLITQTKQDPLDLARRILANAWTLGCASLGGLGWWLIGPLHYHHRTRSAEQPNCRPWHHFSAEIRNGHIVDSGYSSCCDRTWNMPHSRDVHSEPPGLPPLFRSQPHLFPCDDCVEPSSRRTLRVWFQFSLMVVLAVGMAVKYGPGVLLADLTKSHMTTRSHSPNKEDEAVPRYDDGDDTVKMSRSALTGSPTGDRSEMRNPFGNIAFAETSKPDDFEAG